MLFRRRKDGAGSDPADERATSIADGEDHEAHAPAAGGDDDEPPPVDGGMTLYPGFEAGG